MFVITLSNGVILIYDTANVTHHLLCTKFFFKKNEVISGLCYGSRPQALTESLFLWSRVLYRTGCR